MNPGNDKASMNANPNDQWLSILCKSFNKWLKDEATRDRLKRLLDISVRSNSEDQLVLVVGQVLSLLGFDTDSRRLQTSEGRIRSYRVASESTTQLQRILDARACYREVALEDTVLCEMSS